MRRYTRRVTTSPAPRPRRRAFASSTSGAAPDATRARAEALRVEILDHDRRYYELAQPTIGDNQYDALVAELRALEAAHPDLATPESPTQRVSGRPAEEFAVVEHREPMLSLGNVFGRDGLLA